MKPLPKMQDVMKNWVYGRILIKWSKDVLRIFLLIFASSFGFSAIAMAAASPGTNSARVLKQAVSARALGMAEAYVAVADDMPALHYNPAGLARLQTGEMSAIYVKGLVDTYYGYLGYAHPADYGTIAASILTLHGGNMEINEEDGTSTTLIAQQDYVITFGGGFYVASMPTGLAMGLAAKIIRSTLVEEYSAQAFAADIGMYYDTPLEGVALGITFKNIGTELKYLETSDSLPYSSRAGLSYQKKWNNQRFTGACDVVDLDKIHFGIEYSLNDLLFGRIGYKHGYDLESFTAGLGFKYDALQFDYALGFMGEMEYNHFVSITARF